VWGWGENARGQLLDGTTTPRLTPVRLGGPLESGGVLSMAAAIEGYLLWVRDDGTLWGWGNNDGGKLAPCGTSEFLSVPAPCKLD
jgi:hypothetical protein